ncbi:MAG: OstA family protein [Novosphingobium sp.]|nr:OstA family protein [Novosphingobium sp.]
MQRPLSPRLSRFAICAALFIATGIVGLQSLPAQSLGGHDSNAPVNYAADRIELQGRQDRVVLSGNVDVTQGDLRVRAARTIVNFTNEGSLRIQRITATGGVVVTRGTETARGDVAVYDFNRRVITMTGNAALRRGGDTLNGNRFVIDLNSGVSSAEGGRVSGTFQPPRKN